VTVLLKKNSIIACRVNPWMVVQEIDQLCEEWTPEPLHPLITDDMETSTPVLERYMCRPLEYAHEKLLRFQGVSRST